MQKIHQKIETEIFNYLTPLKDQYAEQQFDFDIDVSMRDNDVLVEVWGFYKNESAPNGKTEFILLRLYVRHQCTQIHITNIFLPDFMRYKCIGKHLINKIFLISEEVHYELFIVDMVPSFYQKMINKGALPCIGQDDVVKIVKGTELF